MRSATIIALSRPSARPSGRACARMIRWPPGRRGSHPSSRRGNLSPRRRRSGLQPVIHGCAEAATPATRSAARNGPLIRFFRADLDGSSLWAGRAAVHVAVAGVRTDHVTAAPPRGGGAANRPPASRCGRAGRVWGPRTDPHRSFASGVAVCGMATSTIAGDQGAGRVLAGAGDGTRLAVAALPTGLRASAHLPGGAPRVVTLIGSLRPGRKRNGKPATAWRTYSPTPGVPGWAGCWSPTRRSGRRDCGG